MFVFGHVGIGRQLASRWWDRLPPVPLVLGILLPDIIDKPLYYLRLWSYVSCTRTFGHTGLLLLLLLGAAYALRSRRLAAVGAGMGTHVLLDCVMDGITSGWQDSAWTALTWPLIHQHFAARSMEIATHLAGLWTLPLVLTEAVGLVLILRQVRRVRGSGSHHSPQ